MATAKLSFVPGFEPWRLAFEQRLARVLHVGVRHRRVLAEDVHAADDAVLDGMHDFDDGQSAFLI